ncbi:MAG TPA: ScpA family protein [Actinomycetes bacterium]|nr:ScpA family protein [Actinomycetes bacterium]
MSTSYIVRTPQFEGPFDLLLHLIARQRVDLWQVSLATITEEYLAEIRRMRQLNLDVATEFLVVAATLVELKAARLLPAPDDGVDPVEAALEERDLLFARLLQYQAYKQVAGLFEQRFAGQARYVPRTVGPGEFLATLVPDLLATVSPVDLARRAARALVPPPRPGQAEHVAPPPPLSLTETVAELARELERLRACTFARLLGGRAALPIEVVVRFLALLELYKRSLIELDQAGPFTDIGVRWLAGGAGTPGEPPAAAGPPPDGGPRGGR